MSDTKTAGGTASAAGLRGVVAAQTTIGDVNGERGELIYEGINIHELAEHSTFEEIVFLLWHGRLPKQAELDELRRNLSGCYELPEEIYDLMRRFPRDAEPMDTLRTIVSALDFYDKSAHDTTREGGMRTATRLTAQMPTIVAAIGRLRRGEEPVHPKPELNIATNFLYMLRGEMPTEEDAHLFDVCLILHADHELNASTFTARVVAATLADIYGAVTAAIAALSGPLHGGANTNVMKTLLEIGGLANVESYIKDALGAQSQDYGVRPRRLSHGRPARHAPQAILERGWRARRRHEVVRHLAQGGRGRDARKGSVSERRFLFCFGVLHDGNPA